MNPEIFVGRCLILQNHGFRMTVNVVAWPEQMYLIPAWAEMFRSHGLRFHVDPYSSIAYYAYEYTDTEPSVPRALDLGESAGRTECREAGAPSFCVPAGSTTSTCNPTAPRGDAFSNGNLRSTRWGMCLNRDSDYSKRRVSAMNPGSVPHATATRS